MGVFLDKRKASFSPWDSNARPSGPYPGSYTLYSGSYEGKKVKFTLAQAMKGQARSRGKALLFL
jgi:hypothetical protein